MQNLKKLFYVVQTNTRYYNIINPIRRKNEGIASSLVHRFKHDSMMEIEGYEENEEEKDIYRKISEDYLGTVVGRHNVFIIQPYIKWGVNKKRITTPELQLAEAVALTSTLPNWSIVGTKIVPLLTLTKNKLIGKGSLENLRNEIRSNPNITAVFVSTNLLRFVQIAELQSAFRLPIYDRYSMVVHIFREHAKSPEAMLQVALAEIPYIKKKMVDLSDTKLGKINMDEGRKKYLENREKKLKNALKKLKEHRTMIKSRRQICGFPSVAVVGYTNAGKTSLIKALTGDASLQPRNQLFATLDTTVHQGYLPNKLKILYIDTIGFIQDVPEALIEPFKVTLEDAIDADIIIHVYDVSHPDLNAQLQHIEKTIKPMIGDDKLVINVANKCDMIDKDSLKKHDLPEDTYAVSAVKLTGIDLLRFKLEEEIVKAANLISKRIRVQVGSHLESLLYKEATVTDTEPDSEDPQYMIMNVILSTSSYYKIKRACKV
ncbi:putative GTP-binding protein 6 [Lasioglossum baleicum]|uniref:putative GTP-binding protein 6 n=1 Tax=Lasioglossum baleicum TaxID=434251 RepID=UPI003FCE33B0